MQVQPLAQALRRIDSAALSSGLEPSQRYRLESQNDSKTTLTFSPEILTTWVVSGLVLAPTRQDTTQLPLSVKSSNLLLERSMRSNHGTISRLIEVL